MKGVDTYLNIAMLGHKRIPSREGGIEVVVEELSTRMVRLGNQVTCFNRRGHHAGGKQFDSAKLEKYKGIKLKSVPTINRKGLAAVTSSIFGSICAAFGKYDVVHIHAEGPAFMCWLPKLMGKKVVVTVHGLDHQRAKWGSLARFYIMAGEKNSVKYADEIIVLSRNVQDYFRRVYSRDTVFIANGVNRPEIVEAKEIIERWGLEQDGYVLFLGRLVPEKGLRYLIDAFKQISTGKKLVIAGGSSDTNAFIKELKKMSQGDARIVFTGFVQGRLLKELYSNAYVYVLPSDLEGMSLSLLEGMSYGNCCLVSDIPECVEVVGDKAVLFQKSNIVDLKQKLQMLCNEKEVVNKYRKYAADFSCNSYDWNDVVRRTLDLYKNEKNRSQQHKHDKRPKLLGAESDG